MSARTVATITAADARAIAGANQIMLTPTYQAEVYNGFVDFSVADRRMSARLRIGGANLNPAT